MRCVSVYTETVSLTDFKCSVSKIKTDVDDPTGELAAQLTEKYLSTAVMGNFTSMIPGLTDVRNIPLICSKFSIGKEFNIDFPLHLNLNRCAACFS